MKRAMEEWQLDVKKASVQASQSVKASMGEHVKLSPGLYTKYEVAKLMGFPDSLPGFEDIAEKCVHGLEETENPNAALQALGHSLYVYTHKKTTIAGSNVRQIGAEMHVKINPGVYDSFQEKLLDATFSEALHIENPAGS
jgi:hypothetical protein